MNNVLVAFFLSLAVGSSLCAWLAFVLDRDNSLSFLIEQNLKKFGIVKPKPNHRNWVTSSENLKPKRIVIFLALFALSANALNTEPSFLQTEGYEELAKILMGGIGALVLALIIFIVESLRDPYKNIRGKILLADSYLLPITLLFVSSFVFLIDKKVGTPEIILLVILGIFVICSFFKVLRYLLFEDCFIEAIKEYLLSEFEGSIYQSTKKNFAQIMLREELKRRDINFSIKMFVFSLATHNHGKLAKGGVVKDISLSKLKSISSLIRSHFPEISEDSKVCFIDIEYFGKEVHQEASLIATSHKVMFKNQHALNTFKLLAEESILVVPQVVEEDFSLDLYRLKHLIISILDSDSPELSRKYIKILVNLIETFPSLPSQNFEKHPLQRQRGQVIAWVEVDKIIDVIKGVYSNKFEYLFKEESDNRHIIFGLLYSVSRKFNYYVASRLLNMLFELYQSADSSQFKLNVFKDQGDEYKYLVRDVRQRIIDANLLQESHLIFYKSFILKLLNVLIGFINESIERQDDVVFIAYYDSLISILDWEALGDVDGFEYAKDTINYELEAFDYNKNELEIKNTRLSYIKKLKEIDNELRGKQLRWVWLLQSFYFPQYRTLNTIIRAKLYEDLYQGLTSAQLIEEYETTRSAKVMTNSTLRLGISIEELRERIDGFFTFLFFLVLLRIQSFDASALAENQVSILIGLFSSESGKKFVSGFGSSSQYGAITPYSQDSERIKNAQSYIQKFINKELPSK